MHAHLKEYLPVVFIIFSCHIIASHNTAPNFGYFLGTFFHQERFRSKSIKNSFFSNLVFFDFTFTSHRTAYTPQCNLMFNSERWKRPKLINHNWH